MLNIDPQTAMQWVAVIREGGAVVVLLGVIIGTALGKIWFWPAVRLFLSREAAINEDYRALAKVALAQQQARAEGQKR